MEKDKADLPIMLVAALASAGLGIADVLNVSKCGMWPLTCKPSVDDIAMLSSTATVSTSPTWHTTSLSCHKT
jgi:hypothetical protein